MATVLLGAQGSVFRNALVHVQGSVLEHVLMIARLVAQEVVRLIALTSVIQIVQRYAFQHVVVIAIKVVRLLVCIMGVPVHALKEDVVLLPHVQLYALALVIVHAQQMEGVLKGVTHFLVFHYVLHNVQITTVLEIAQVLVPQTAQLPVAQRQLAAVAYAQMHVKGAVQHAQVLVQQVTHVKVFVIQLVEEHVITDVVELVHLLVI